MPKSIKVSRSAVTGKFVKKSYAKSQPKTTVTEAIKRVTKTNKLRYYSIRLINPRLILDLENEG